MFANKRIINAKGLVNKPIISTGIINGYNHFGTCGVNTCPQYVLVPLMVVITKVNNANTKVTAIFPVTFDPPGKKGTNPNTLFIQIKKNTVSRYGINLAYFSPKLGRAISSR